MSKKNRTRFDRAWYKYQNWLKETPNPISFIEWRFGPNPNQRVVGSFIKTKGWC